MVLVVSPVGRRSVVSPRGEARAAPQCPKKLLPSGLSCPQLVQKGIGSRLSGVPPREISRRDAEFRPGCSRSGHLGSGQPATCSAYASASSRSSRSAASSISSSNSQPSPYGSAFTVSGLLSSSVLIADTTPGTGQKMSETLLVDSSSPHASPAATDSPTEGSEAKTMSPSWSAAYSVIPTLTVLPFPLRTHSCSAVYFRSSG